MLRLRPLMRTVTSVRSMGFIRPVLIPLETLRLSSLQKFAMLTSGFTQTKIFFEFPGQVWTAST